LPFCHISLKARKPKNSAYPTDPKTLGDHLRQKRLDLGMTQKGVADRIGVDEATIYNWEANRKHPAGRLIPRIIQFLGYCPQVQEVTPATPAGKVIA
jgi:DNA-binding XRE family transcriptional regulator